MTSPDHYDYCAIYLRGPSRDAVVELAVRATGAARQGSALHIDGIDIDILRNPDASHAAPDAADFPVWPIKIEIERGDATSRQMVTTVSQILTSAWQAGYDAVAACDYEDELPEQGGYARHRSRPLRTRVHRFDD